MENVQSPLVSVIVPTKNSGRFLRECLESIKNQTYKNIEIIVVDNFSTDNTRQIALEYTDKFFEKGPERSAQRNFGVENSAGEFVAIIDSDMVLSKDVIEECVDKMQIRNVSGIVIPEESFGIGFWAQCKKLERSFYLGQKDIEAARFFNREIYLQVGGFNLNMISGEDWDLSRRIEKLGNIERINSFIYHNEGSVSLVNLLKKKYYYAQKSSEYLNQYNLNNNTSKIKEVYKRYRLFLSDPVKLFKNPFYGAGVIFMKSCEYIVGYFGIIKNK